MLTTALGPPCFSSRVTLGGYSTQETSGRRMGGGGGGGEQDLLIQTSRAMVKVQSFIVKNLFTSVYIGVKYLLFLCCLEVLCEMPVV